MSKLLKLLGGSAAPLLDKAAEVADRFIDTPAEKKAFIKEAYQQEVLDRKEARELGLLRKKLLLKKHTSKRC